MALKFLSLADQRGDTTIMLALILALGVGTTVYYNMDKLNQTLRSNKISSQKDRAETRNLSALSQATALMRYSGSDPADANALPYIYPEPYLPTGGVFDTPRASPNAATWSFANMSLVIKSPAESNLNTASFEKYLFQDQNTNRPDLSNKTTIKFLKPVMSTGANTYLITHYEAEVSSSSFDAQNLVSKANIPVPPPLTPTCTLTSDTGATDFQPNTPIGLVLTVSGIAVSARIPDTTEALIASAGDISKHSTRSLIKIADSVRRVQNRVATWQVPSPRPLVAVDGENDVQFRAYAYLHPVDNNDDKGASCSFDYKVSPPANCKLWTDKASVPPGQCVNITSGTVGPVQANSLVMSAEDPMGNPVPGLTQNGSKGTFCTPAASSFATGTPVPPTEAATYESQLTKLSSPQQSALYDVLADLQKNLATLFKNSPELLNLSIGQFNDLWNLGPAQFANMSTLDFSTFTYLKTLTTDQQNAFRALVESDFKPLESMIRIDFSTHPVLKTADAASLANLMTYDSKLLLSYIGSKMDAAAASSATPIDYKLVGKVKDKDGTQNSCIVHVTAGTNQCDFYGSQFPNKKEKLTVSVNFEGKQSSFSFDFAPSAPNWEVEGIATSPAKVAPCPTGARCYAVDIGNNRTPFVTVDNADQNTCTATANMRIDLGCFEANTKIRMADGSDKSIRQLKQGDRVYNPLRKQAAPIKRVTQGPEKHPLWTVTTEDGTVQVTSQHPFLTAQGMKEAAQLKVGDRILGARGEQSIQSVSEAKDLPAEWVWNFEFDTDSKDPADHAVLADGVVTGDLYLQEQLARSQFTKFTQLKP